MRSKFKIFFLFIPTLMITASPSRAGSELFPVPSGMEGHVAFWEAVFTVYSTDQIIFHDSDQPERIYSVLRVNLKSSDRKVIRTQIRQERNQIQLILQQLSRNPNPKSPSEKVENIRQLFGEQTESEDFKRAASRIRVQRGMRETFQTGLEQSGRYSEDMRRILRDEQVPEDLVCLPHVESSFNPLARSKAGASGIWQFTSKTGRLYMSICSTVDERKDPIASTRAAAKLLQSNYQILKSWPLAVTAYNHGPSGVKRAVRKTGSRDLGQIIRKYRSRRFGFASRNFYAEFLAARRIAMNAGHYFKGIFYDPAFHVRPVTLTESMIFSRWANQVNWPRDVLAEINPALSSAILLDRIPIPARASVNVPLNEKAAQQIALALSASIYWASNFGESPDISIAWFSATVAPSVETRVRMPDPIQNDSLRETRFSDVSAPRSVQDLIAFADPQARSEIPTVSEPEGENALASVLPELPSFEPNLAIREGGRITVQPEETLGHYADWLGIPTWKLRRINRLRYGQNIRLGQSIRLAFEKISEQEFIQRREAHHQEIRNNFFMTHQISDVRAHVIRPGENFWTVANDSSDVPLWLIFAYNGNNPVHRLKPGDRLRVPVITPKQNTG